MTRPGWLLMGCACIAALAFSHGSTAADAALTETQPRANAEVSPYLAQREPVLSREQQIALLRQKVKYVFVLFQENRSYDSYFGSFPGGRGLFAQSPGETAGYTQPLLNTDGTMTTVHPFRIGPAQHAADVDDIDHSHVRMAQKMNVQHGVALMDRFALVEELKYMTQGAKPSLRAKQYGELAMAYEDCDTVPFLWNDANRFVLFDTIFQLTVGPSAPGAISIIAGQTGETQWVKHPESASNAPANAARGVGEPVVENSNPAFPPINPGDRPSAQLNQTYASLPLTLAGRSLADITAADRHPGTNSLADVSADIPAIVAGNRQALPWRWYEEGYDREPTDPPGTGPEGTHNSYIAHHNGAQYFGYIADNPKMASNLRGLGDFFADMAAAALPAEGGLYYVRGGYHSIDGLKPAFDDPAVQARFQGDDDHPGTSDSELSDALVARAVNAIARSPYWNESVIVITYDESEGNYDHMPPPVLTNDPNGLTLERGSRIPLLVISPYTRAHVISHEAGDQASIIKLVDILFGLPPLADVPEELAARVTGETKLGQSYLGPSDDLTPGVGDLLSAFDPARLTGDAPPLPPSYAEIPGTP